MYYTDMGSPKFQSVLSFLKSYSAELSPDQAIRLQMLLENGGQEKGKDTITGAAVPYNRPLYKFISFSPFRMIKNSN